MQDNKKQGLLEMSITAVKVLLLVMLVFTTFVFVYYGIIDRGDTIKKEQVRFIEDWTTIYEEGNNQTIISILPSELADNEYLYFDTRKDVSVYINGTLRKDFIEERDVNIPGGSFRRFLFKLQS